MTLDAMKESRPEVGSSQNIRGGFIRSFNSNTVRVSFNTVRMIRLPLFIPMNSFYCRQQGLRTNFSLLGYIKVNIICQATANRNIDKMQLHAKQLLKKMKLKLSVYLGGK